jgi:uncharacterized protein YndB with AHSA1/START domain
MAIMSPVAQTGKASTVKKTFSRETLVSIEIRADLSIIWSLLTDASGFRRWNSTIISIDGNIATGEKINLRSTLAPKRTFKLKVKEFHRENKLVWGDAMGSRIYTLTKSGDSSVLFSFEQFAADLKKEAESIMNLNNKKIIK